MTENELQDAILDLAKLLKLKVHHCRPARTKDGWKTPVAGDKGFPDLVIAGPGGVVFAELKSVTGRVTPEQAEWADLLDLTVPCFVWRPGHWKNGNIEHTLRSLS